MNSLINMMTNHEGWTITTIYITLIVLIISAKIILRYVYKNKYYNIQNYLLLILTIIPASFMFIIGERWVFGPNYLPTNNPVNDLTFSGFHFVFYCLDDCDGHCFCFYWKKGTVMTIVKHTFMAKWIKLITPFSALVFFYLRLKLISNLCLQICGMGSININGMRSHYNFALCQFSFSCLHPGLKTKPSKTHHYEFIGLYVTLAGLLV